MAITEIVVAEKAVEGAAEAAVIKTAEAGAAAVEFTESAEVLESVGSLRQLSEIETNYLAELNVSEETWQSLSFKEQATRLETIGARLKEMDINPAMTDLHNVLGHHITEAVEQNNGLDVLSPNEQIEPVKTFESCDDVRYDDNGEKYWENGTFSSNTDYELNGCLYQTDDFGRIVHVEADVTISDTPRASLNKCEVKGMEVGDDKGHVVAHILGGADTEGNLVPMDAGLNRGEYKSMELYAKKCLSEGKTVNMTVDLDYTLDNSRPDSLLVTLEIDDDITVKKFLN